MSSGSSFGVVREQKERTVPLLHSLHLKRHPRRLAIPHHLFKFLPFFGNAPPPRQFDDNGIAMFTNIGAGRSDLG